MKRMGLALSVMLLLRSAALAQTGGMMCEYEQQNQRWGWGHGMMGGYGMVWPGGIIMLAFWALVIIGLVFLIRWIAASTKGEGRASGDTPLDILKKRYAKGEINKEEFEEKKKDLEIRP